MSAGQLGESQIEVDPGGRERPKFRSEGRPTFRAAIDAHGGATCSSAASGRARALARWRGRAADVCAHMRRMWAQGGSRRTGATGAGAGAAPSAGECGVAFQKRHLLRRVLRDQ